MFRMLNLVFAAAVVTALALAAACGDDDKDEGPTPNATPSVTAAAPDEVQLTDEDNGATVELSRQGTLIIALESNRSTGFSWYVGEAAGPELALRGEPRYLPPGSTSPVAGAAGTQVFTFDVTDVGLPPAGETAVVQLALEYKRSFEPGVAAEKTFAVTVRIR